MPELITRIYKNKYLRGIWILTGVNLLLAAVQLITHRIPTLIYFILVFLVLGLQFLIFSDAPHQLFFIPFCQKLSSATKMSGTVLGAERTRYSPNY